MDYNVDVRLLAVTPDSETLLETAGRLCYNSTDKLGTSENWLSARVKQGHESLIEHASATFSIRASRVLTHELVRHRIASYSQRSQRYVKEQEEEYITPPELDEENNHEVVTIFQEAMSAAWSSYKRLLDIGVKPELARYVLPNACATEIICTWNFREIRHIINLRTGPAALPEFRAVALRIRNIMKTQSPQIFGDL